MKRIEAGDELSMSLKLFAVSRLVIWARFGRAWRRQGKRRYAGPDTAHFVCREPERERCDRDGCDAKAHLMTLRSLTRSDGDPTGKRFLAVTVCPEHREEVLVVDQVPCLTCARWPAKSAAKKLWTAQGYLCPGCAQIFCNGCGTRSKPLICPSCIVKVAS